MHHYGIVQVSRVLRSRRSAFYCGVLFLDGILLARCGYKYPSDTLVHMHVRHGIV
ncbi:hypothetical protein BDV18DRAFT_146350 [Aspergillus unguis]